MATDSILGLFTTPEQYALNQRAQVQQQLAREAEMDPYQRANYLAGMSGYSLGTTLGNVFGVQDPMLQQLSTIRKLSSQFDTGTSGGLSAMANALREQGLIGPAFQIGQKAAELRKLEAEAQAKTMERLTPEQRNAAAIADSSGALRGTEDWARAYNTELGRMTTKNTRTTDQKNFEQAREEGYKGTFNQWLTEQNRSKATNIGITQKQEEAITKSNVEAFGNLRDEAIAAAKTIESVQAIKPLINRAFTGFAADTKLTAAQIADTFGIPIQGTSETEKLRSIQNNLKIGNSTVLKGAISDKDMAILGQAIGQGNTTAGGIRGIINDLEKNALISQAKYQRANQFQQAGKLSQYDFVEGGKAASSEVNAKLKRLRELESKASQGAK